MSSTSSKSSKSRRSSILKVRQTTVDTKVDVVEQPKNRRRVSFHHQKTVKEYDKEKHELSATSPLKEAVKEAMSDFDSTKSLGTPDRTTGDNHTMMLFKGMMSSGHSSSVHHELKDMSFSIIEDPANSASPNDTLNILNGLHSGHVSIHSKSVDISYRMEDSMNENAADNTLDIFRKPSANQSTRTPANMTMDMDISKADNTLTDGAFEGDDTMGIFGATTKNNEALDNTMDVFTSGSGGSDKSRMSQSILMDMSSNHSPRSSQDRTMAIFGSGSQSNESVAMEEATMIEEEKKADNSPLKSSLPSLPRTLDESQSPGHDDTMAMFGVTKPQETGDEDVPMEMSMAVGEGREGGGLPSLPSSQDEPPSPTMNIFKRKGEDELDDEQTMNVFTSKRWKEDGDITVGDIVEQGGSQELKESRVANEGFQKSVFMDEEEATMNVFGVKIDETINKSVLMEDGEEGKDNESILEISTKTAVEGSTEHLGITTCNEDRTFDCFNEVGETSQMDMTGGASRTLDGVKSSGGPSEMDVSERDESLILFGKEEEEEGEDKKKEDTFVVLEEKKKTKENENQENTVINQSIMEENWMACGNGSDDMMEVTPLPSQSPPQGETRKTRLSTVIEVSSHYTLASSQSMRQRVESTEEESKDGGILDRMDDNEHALEGKKEVEIDTDESERMEEESMVDSPSPSGNNTTFSATLTKRNMLDETRLSDRSMMNITRTFDELVLEKIEWMRRESELEDLDKILKEQRIPFVEDLDRSIQRSESAVKDLLSQITQSENGDLLTTSIQKLNAAKVQEYRYLFEWARREAQREWWEKRAEKGENVNEELERRMIGDEEELMKAKEDVIMMAQVNELKEDVESLEKEVKVGRGLSRISIDELIGESKKNEEKRDRLQREVNRLELENMKHSTIAIKIMAERCNAIEESIKRKMEEREKNKREMRTYLSQLTNNLK